MLALGALAACGGGGGNSTPNGGGATTLALQGVAATGAAIPGAAVLAKCNGGSGNATTASDGSYSITLTAGTLPCVLEVTPTTGPKLYSVAVGSGTSVKANVTPLTQLIVAKLAGKDPAAYFTAFGAGDITALTASAVTLSQAAVVDTLKNSGVDASAVGNLLSGNLVAASGGNAGNAMDLVLDALNTKLTTAGVTLAQLTTLVTQTSAAATPSGTVSLPPDLVLQPAAATCTALRSGTYRTINPQIGPLGDHGSASVGKVVVDVVAATMVFSDNSTATLAPVAGTPCRFTNSNGAEITVSQSGVIAAETAAPKSLAILFPEQAIALADLAGSWNLLGFDRATLADPLIPASRTVTMNGTGSVVVNSNCTDAKTCTTTGLPTRTLVANPAGGFDLTDGTSALSRAFAFRAGGGELMLATVAGDGTWALGTRVRTATLPTAGTVNLGWNVGATNVLSAGNYQQAGIAITDFSNTVLSVNAPAGTFARDNVTNFTSVPPVTRPETIELNSVAGAARTGYNYRQPGSVTNSAGATVNVPEFIQLQLRGMGLNAIGLPGATAAASQFLLSVIKP
ncbi:MAG: hypothetical protein AB3X44_16435 [Leptothrix sp. (in: b-proteobacteria)]